MPRIVERLSLVDDPFPEVLVEFRARRIKRHQLRVYLPGIGGPESPATAGSAIISIPAHAAATIDFIIGLSPFSLTGLLRACYSIYARISVSSPGLSLAS